VTVRARETLQAVVSSAVDATGAAQGWLFALDGGELVVAAAASGGQVGTPDVVDRRFPVGTGTASFVVQSGQPVALQPGAGGSSGDELGAQLLGRQPLAVLATPALADDRVVGALQVVDKFGGGAFSFDDVEIVGLLGGIAGAALSESGAASLQLPSPAQLAGELERLAHTDPARYATVAGVVEVLLGQL
jgi:GAF domain-containing protein